MARNLVETTVDLVKAEVKANIANALASIRNDRADSYVTTEPPVNFFITEQSIGYRAPSVFFIVEDMDFMIPRGANHINALVRMNVSVVVEDRNTERLTYKAWRYQASLHSILAQDSLTSADGAVTLKIKVVNATFSPLYTNSQKPDTEAGFYRKEVLLRLEIEHYENL